MKLLGDHMEMALQVTSTSLRPVSVRFPASHVYVMISLNLLVSGSVLIELLTEKGTGQIVSVMHISNASYTSKVSRKK